MSNRATTPKKFCRVAIYLKHKYPVLWENIQDLCLSSMFSTGRGKSVTFILPDKKTQSKINKLVGTDPEDAINLLRCHTVKAQVNNMSDFSDGLPCMNGKEIRAVNTTSTYAELSNGVKLTKAKDYLKQFPDQRDDVLVASGDVSTATAEKNTSSESTPIKTGSSSKRRSRTRSKRGSGNNYSGGNDADLLLNTKYKENTNMVHKSVTHIDRLMRYTVTDLEASSVTGQYSTYHYLGAYASLLKYMRESHTSLYNLLKKLKVYGPLSSFCLMRLLDDNKNTHITNWLKTQRTYMKNDEIKKFIERGSNDLGVKFTGKNKSASHIKNILTPNITNICDVMCNDLKVFLLKELTNEEKKEVTNWWGDGKQDDSFDQLASFLLVNAEINYVFGRKYVKGRLSSTSDVNEMKLINSSVRRHICLGESLSNGKCNWKDCVFLFDQTIMSAVQQKGLFCMALRVWLDTSLLSPGWREEDDLNSGNVFVNNTKISTGPDPSPNSLGLTTSDSDFYKLVDMMGN